MHTDKARAALDDLLDRDEDMADAPTYADEHKQEIRGSAPWHYVNVPLSADRYDNRFCGDKGCVVSKIKEFRDILKDNNLPDDQGSPPLLRRGGREHHGQANGHDQDVPKPSPHRLRKPGGDPARG